MNIFLTGYSGKIGSKISNSLQSSNHKLFKINLREDPSNFSQRELDGKTCFIHMASLNKRLYKKDISTELNLMKDAISICSQNKIKNFLFLSTYKVYKTNHQSKEIENDLNISTNDSYAKAKIMCERLLIESANNFDSIIILRMPPVLMSSKHSNLGYIFKVCDLIPILPFFRLGNENKRSFLSINNIVSFINYVLQKELSGNFILNFADSFPISTNELIRQYLKKYHPNKKTFYFPNAFEQLLLKLPFLSKILDKLYGSKNLDTSILKNTFPDFTIQDTSSSILKYGIISE